MKTILKIIIIVMLGALCFRASAQSWALDGQNAKLFYFWDGSDTLVDADTLTVVYPKTLDHQWRTYVVMTADSLDGGPGGQAYLQGSYDLTNWINLDTLTFDGAGQYTTTYTNTALLPLQIRIEAISSGTCEIRLTEAYMLLKRN